MFPGDGTARLQVRKQPIRRPPALPRPSWVSNHEFLETFQLYSSSGSLKISWRVKINLRTSCSITPCSTNQTPTVFIAHGRPEGAITTWPWPRWITLNSELFRPGHTRSAISRSNKPPLLIQHSTTWPSCDPLQTPEPSTSWVLFLFFRRVLSKQSTHYQMNKYMYMSYRYMQIYTYMWQVVIWCILLGWPTTVSGIFACILIVDDFSLQCANASARNEHAWVCVHCVCRCVGPWIRTPPPPHGMTPEGGRGGPTAIATTATTITIIKGSLEETSELRTAQKRCDWIVKSITWDVNWIVKSITWDVNWIVKSITWDVNWIVKSITWDVNWIVKSITWDVNWIVKWITGDVNWTVKSITWDVNWIVKSITWDVNWIVKSITWDVNWIVKSITWDVNWIVKSITWDVNWIVKASRRDVFYSTDDVPESKMAREMLCFTMETGVVGWEGRICETAVAGYVRAIVAPLSQ